MDSWDDDYDNNDDYRTYNGDPVHDSWVDYTTDIYEGTNLTGENPVECCEAIEEVPMSDLDYRWQQIKERRREHIAELYHQIDNYDKLIPVTDDHTLRTHYIILREYYIKQLSEEYGLNPYEQKADKPAADTLVAGTTFVAAGCILILLIGILKAIFI